MIKLIDHPCMSLCSRHFRNDKLEVVKYVVKDLNGSINAKDNIGYTPFDYARW